MLRPADLHGSDVDGTLQISERALNEVLHALQPPGRTAPTLEILDGNRVRIRYGVLHAHAFLPSALETGRQPKMTIGLASVVVALGLRAAVQHPAIQIHGKRLTIDLMALPPVGPWQRAAQYITRAEFRTRRGTVQVNFNIAIQEQGHA